MACCGSRDKKKKSLLPLIFLLFMGVLGISFIYVLIKIIF